MKEGQVPRGSCVNIGRTSVPELRGMGVLMRGSDSNILRDWS